MKQVVIDPIEVSIAQCSEPVQAGGVLIVAPPESSNSHKPKSIICPSDIGNEGRRQSLSIKIRLQTRIYLPSVRGVPSDSNTSPNG